MDFTCIGNSLATIFRWQQMFKIIADVLLALCSLACEALIIQSSLIGERTHKG